METRRLDELCVQITDCPHSTPQWLSSGKLVLRNFNIHNGRIDLSNVSYTDDKKDKGIQLIKYVINQ